MSMSGLCLYLAVLLDFFLSPFTSRGLFLCEGMRPESPHRLIPWRCGAKGCKQRCSSREGYSGTISRTGPFEVSSVIAVPISMGSGCVYSEILADVLSQGPCPG